MPRYTLFLRTPLFHAGGAKGHVPTGVLILEGDITARESGTLTVETTSLQDDRGNELSDATLSLTLPMSKVDHILNHPE